MIALLTADCDAFISHDMMVIRHLCICVSTSTATLRIAAKVMPLRTQFEIARVAMVLFAFTIKPLFEVPSVIHSSSPAKHRRHHDPWPPSLPPSDSEAGPS